MTERRVANPATGRNGNFNDGREKPESSQEEMGVQPGGGRTPELLADAGESRGTSPGTSKAAYTAFECSWYINGVPDQEHQYLP
tara:strand:- start:200 stop:451 length:252 start_codon:yes stop_codon:yes gene_type:complete